MAMLTDSASTRQLYHITLRSVCEGSEERLFLQEPVDHLTTEMEITDAGREWTKKYLASFREAIPEDETKAVLQDKTQTGWLAWGKKIEVSRFTGWEETAYELDPACKNGLAIYDQAIEVEGFWTEVGPVPLAGVAVLRDHELIAVGGSMGAGGPAKLSVSDAHRLHPCPQSALWPAGIRGCATHR